MKSANQNLSLDLQHLASEKLGNYALAAAQLERIAPRLKNVLEEIQLERKQGQHRYRELPYDTLMYKAVLDDVKRCRSKTDNLVILGIGGSALGNIALHQALNHPQYNLLPKSQRKFPRLFVMDNVDPTYFSALLDIIGRELPRTLFNVITKSGETAETAAQFLIIRDLLLNKLGPKKTQQQILVTTDPLKGAMREIVQQEGYPSLPVPEGVGGRFSVLSAVGLFSASMCGINIKSLLKGAADMDRQANDLSMKNPAALLAAVHFLYYLRGLQIAVMMPYSNSLYGLADWYRQLWAESLGKANDVTGKKKVNIGPTPIKALGATDQHSQIQLYREGPFDKLITFLEVEKHTGDIKIPRAKARQPSQAIETMSYLGGHTLGQLLNIEKSATEKALLSSQRPCLTIRFPKINEYTVGQFIYLMECATSIIGKLFAINPYDQPGVELGKQITYRLLGRKGFEKVIY